MLIVDEVNRATGDIYFEGSVLVKGNVGYGSQITATDNIVVEGNVETAVIRADGNILIKGGMTGGGTGEIYAGKELHGKFFESTTIKAGDNIHANYCMNCNVCSEREILIAGNKGMIVGGIVQAAYGINVYNLGNRAGIKTIVKLGFEEINAERRCALYDELAQAEKELAIFCNSAAQYKKLYNAEARNTMERYLKIENAIYTEEKIIRKIKKDIEKLQEQSLKAPHPCVIVRGVVYEGTVIEIDKLKWMASTLSDVTIQKKDNKITVYRN
jgi:hypothetical protein